MLLSDIESGEGVNLEWAKLQAQKTINGSSVVASHNAYLDKIAQKGRCDSLDLSHTHNIGILVLVNGGR